MIDELVLLVQPVVKGAGRRLFDGFASHVPMRQMKCVTFTGGVVSLSYEMNVRGPCGPNHQTPPPRMNAQEDTIMTTTTTHTTRELDHRVNDGLDVTLLWNSATDRVSVAVEDERTGEFFEFEVDPGDALIAFNHPYAYANATRTDHALAT
jgi:hypothetical protein